MKKRVLIIMCIVCMTILGFGCGNKSNNESGDIKVGEKYLPVGTVVMLKAGEKPLMIYGRTQKIGDNTDLADYIGVPYPEGFVSNDLIIYFSHDNIDKVLFKGYVTDDEIKLEKYLHEQTEK